MSKFLTVAFVIFSVSISRADGTDAAALYLKGLTVANETMKQLTSKETTEASQKADVKNDMNRDWLLVVLRRQSSANLAQMIRAEAPRLSDFLVAELMLRMAQDLADLPHSEAEDVATAEALKVVAKQDAIFDGIDASVRSLSVIIQRAEHTSGDLAFIRGVAVATGVLRRLTMHLPPTADVEHLFDEMDRSHRHAKMKVEASVFMAKEISTSLDVIKIANLKNALAPPALRLGQAASITGTDLGERAAALDTVFTDIDQKIRDAR